MYFYVPSPIILVYVYPGVVDGGFELPASSFSLATFALAFFATVSRVTYPGRRSFAAPAYYSGFADELLASRGLVELYIVALGIFEGK
jgi:hypothetical protein